MSKEIKIIGELNKEDFIDAIKTILAAKEEVEKDKRSISEKIKDSYNEFKDTVKDIVTFKFVSKLKDDAVKFCNSVRDILTFKFLANREKKEKLPLTKEEFIRRGIKFKFMLSEVVETVVFVLVMVILIRFFIGEIRWIPSGSMKPTLIEGDRIIVERFSRFYSTPKRGDIMVFYPPSTQLSNKPLALLSRLTGIFCKDVAYIKRVVGLPGDKVEIKFEPDGSAYVYINDEKYEEDYIKSIYEFTPCPSEDVTHLFFMPDQILKCGTFKLEHDEYFMMGDNRGDSQDSRYWGPLKGDRFIGRAVSVFWPLNRRKELKRLSK